MIELFEMLISAIGWWPTIYDGRSIRCSANFSIPCENIFRCRGIEKPLHNFHINSIHGHTLGPSDRISLFQISNLPEGLKFSVLPCQNQPARDGNGFWHEVKSRSNRQCLQERSLQTSCRPSQGTIKLEQSISERNSSPEKWGCR